MEEIIEEETQLEQAKRIMEQLKIENDRHEALIARGERLKAEQVLSGKTDAGQAPKAPVEESDADYANKVMANNVETK